MKHEIIIHAGMPKTGTTAIQNALGQATMAECAYASWGETPNHSTAYLTAFSQHAFSEAFDRGRGRSRDEVERERQRYRSELLRLLQRETAPRIVFSAEAFSGTGGLEALADFRNTILSSAERFRVIVYIRPLAGALPSMFQQRCRMSRNKISILPRIRYRAGASRLIDVFGDAVELVPYLPANFPQGDVVADFCDRIGVPHIENAPRANTSMTAEAAALLYFHGLHKAPRAPHPQAVNIQAMVVRALKDIGGTKMRYTRELVTQYAKANRAELDWISAKAGFDVTDMSECRADGVGSVDDLRTLAMNVQDQLQTIIMQQAGKVRSGEIDATARLEQALSAGADEAVLAAQVDILKDISVLRAEQSTQGAIIPGLRETTGPLRDFARKMRRFIPGQRV